MGINRVQQEHETGRATLSFATWGDVECITPIREGKALKTREIVTAGPDVWQESALGPCCIPYQMAC